MVQRLQAGARNMNRSVAEAGPSVCARGLLRVVLPALGLWLLGGCTMTIYQPLVSLQRPTVVDPQLPNLTGMNLLVRCLPTEYLSTSDSQLLCRKVGTLFRNQGANVETIVPRRGAARSSTTSEGGEVDLIVDLSSRLVHKESNGLLTWIAISTMTLVPDIEQFSFAQDVVIRQPDGTLLASDTMQGRFVIYTGIGVWGVNWVLDHLVRQPQDRLTGDAANRDFSGDLYRQLSQSVFNARMRAAVLQGFSAAP
jgi:hypothetical protein